MQSTSCETHSVRLDKLGIEICQQQNEELALRSMCCSPSQHFKEFNDQATNLICQLSLVRQNFFPIKDYWKAVHAIS